MNEILAIVVGFVLTTIAGGWWASRLQDRSWARQNDARMKDEERQRASAACQAVTSLLDKRLYRMQRLLWAAKQSAEIKDDELERRRQDYIEVLIDWNEHLNMNLSIVGSYFGDRARSYLESLYEDFKRVGQSVENVVRTARAGGDALEAASVVEVEFEGRGIGTLNDRVYQFGLMMMGQLRDGLVGRSAPAPSEPNMRK